MDSIAASLLKFKPVPDVDRYEVEVEEVSHSDALKMEFETPVRVPKSIPEPGHAPADVSHFLYGIDAVALPQPPPMPEDDTDAHQKPS